MLKHLEIQNYALIEHLSIDFEHGFSILTGETGAGKSIIMGALSLILGQRADAKSIQNGKSKCVVEAQFEIGEYELQTFFQINDLDYTSVIFVRREVLDIGKSRAFINDTPVNLNLLKELTTRLIDVHSQHANLLLADGCFQMNVVDSIAQNQIQKSDYNKVFVLYRSILEQLNKQHVAAAKDREERDYLQFQYKQLTEAKLCYGEQEDLERELECLNHAQEIKYALAFVMESLDNEEQGVLSRLKDSDSSLRKITSYLSTALGLQERIEACRIELKDIQSEVEHLLNTISFEPNRKSEIEERLSLIYTLQQKHRVSTISELLQLQTSLEEKLLHIDSYDEQIKQLEVDLIDQKQKLTELSNNLTDSRLAVCAEIEQTMNLNLQLLGISNAQFIVSIKVKDDFSLNGKDEVSFLFSANKNGVPQDLATIASGGEISRVMLSLKSLIVTKSLVPTIVFDEIDTGISGEIAHRMGEIMRVMSNTIQVISITHLPQIAAKGKVHYKVFKSDTEAATHTQIARLTAEDRIREIAELLSGKNPSQAALENAKELLQL